MEGSILGGSRKWKAKKNGVKKKIYSISEYKLHGFSDFSLHETWNIYIK